MFYLVAASCLLLFWLVSCGKKKTAAAETPESVSAPPQLPNRETMKTNNLAPTTQTQSITITGGSSKKQQTTEEEKSKKSKNENVPKVTPDSVFKTAVLNEDANTTIPSGFSQLSSSVNGAAPLDDGGYENLPDMDEHDLACHLAAKADRKGKAKA